MFRSQNTNTGSRVTFRIRSDHKTPTEVAEIIVTIRSDHKIPAQVAELLLEYVQITKHQQR